MQFHGFLQETVIAVVVTKVNEARNRLFMPCTEQKTEHRKKQLSELAINKDVHASQIRSIASFFYSGYIRHFPRSFSTKPIPFLQ